MHSTRDEAAPDARTVKSGSDWNGIEIVVTSCLIDVYGGCMSHAISSHQGCPISHPTPSNAEPIRLTATRSCRESHNLLIRWTLELNLMPFRSEHNFFFFIVCRAKLREPLGLTCTGPGWAHARIRYRTTRSARLCRLAHAAVKTSTGKRRSPCRGSSTTISCSLTLTTTMAWMASSPSSGCRSTHTMG